ncbi:hypothetical protein DM02DRAFT_635565 [Periconia macrospinosa]|uniref:ubiquitinyl hydrolase 1 n=1 Tax=Periconia macrospinosa TaxID=97972 RepID=A0A2V1D2G7_9PLEO|nr:hypothetical protein DM02DRAFT_635565 [Periconia macrospinosa]
MADFTKEFSQHGTAFTSWTFIKKIHSSFAKKMMPLRAKRAARVETKQAAAAALSKSTSKTTKNSSASASTSRVQRDSLDSDDNTVNFENDAHHYTAFLLINGTVWKLDGMDAQPTDMRLTTLRVLDLSQIYVADNTNKKINARIISLVLHGVAPLARYLAPANANVREAGHIIVHLIVVFLIRLYHATLLIDPRNICL